MAQYRAWQLEHSTPTPSFKKKIRVGIFSCFYAFFRLGKKQPLYFQNYSKINGWAVISLQELNKRLSRQKCCYRPYYFS